MSKIMSQNQEYLLQLVKEDLEKLHEKQRDSSEIEYVQYDFMRLYKIISLIEFLNRIAGEAESHMNFTKRKYHQLEFDYMDLQEKYDELLESVVGMEDETEL